MGNFEEGNSPDTAIIPKGTVINGNVEIAGKLEMYGVINGDITSDSRVNLCGEVTGNIKANDLHTKDSYIVGHIECARDAVVRENTVIFGDICAENLVIDGAIQGKLDIKDSVTVGEKAILDSDIKAKSIQVNSGAAINGHCSLCYADVNMKDYFPESDEPEVTQEEAPAAEEPKKPRATAKPKAIKKSEEKPE